MKTKGFELKHEKSSWIDKHGLHKHGITIKPKKDRTKKNREKIISIINK